MIPSDSHPPDAAAPSQPLPTSELLIRVVAGHPDVKMSVGELIDGMGGRAFSIILLLLTLPLAVPGPPGLPTAFSIPLLLVTAQLWLGRPAPWLPNLIRKRRFARDGLLSVLKKIRPRLARLESVCRPRLLRMTDRHGERWVGVFYFLCAIVLCNPIPIPFSHIPLAIAMTAFALGFVERDGFLLIGASIGALIGVAINISMTGGAFVLGLKLLHLA
ncbi:MAG: transporter permease [Rhodospirillales bacterium]|nr:transporter permease [Rhodospirillales bacterium]